MMVNAGTIEVVPGEGKSLSIIIDAFPSPQPVWGHFWAGWIKGAAENVCVSRIVNIEMKIFPAASEIRYEFQVSCQKE